MILLWKENHHQYQEGNGYESPLQGPSSLLFYAVFKDFSGSFTGSDPALAMMISKNGIDWELHPTRIFAPKEIPLDDGTSIKVSNLERPQFLINKKGEPVAFYAACSIAGCGPKTDGSTINVQFKVNTKYLLEQ